MSPADRPRKKLLLAINTLGLGGAETALVELLRQIDPARYEVSLRVMLEQGELTGRVPPSVKRLGRCDARDIQSAAGRRALRRRVLARLLNRGAAVRTLPYMLKNGLLMAAQGRVQPDKLLWRAVAEGTPPPGDTYDLAVAYLEGAATHYVSRRVKARRKAAFVHVDYQQAGYTRALDGRVYDAFDRVFCVSEETRASFLQVHPECADRTSVFHNLISRERILCRAGEGSGFSDGWDGPRILTLGRLVSQKALEVSIQAMRLLKDGGVRARWIVLGEGPERRRLEAEIRRLGLADSFLLPGAVENPYPLLRQADVYAHCSRYEGRSLAIREAQVLGRAIVATDCSGNRDQLTDGVDGLLVAFTPEAIAEAVARLLSDAALRRRLGHAAAARPQLSGDVAALLGLADDG